MQNIITNIISKIFSKNFIINNLSWYLFILIFLVNLVGPSDRAFQIAVKSFKPYWIIILLISLGEFYKLKKKNKEVKFKWLSNKFFLIIPLVKALWHMRVAELYVFLFY